MAPPPLRTGRVPSLIRPDVAVTLVPVRGQTAVLVVRHAATEGRAEMNAVNVHKASLDRAARKVSRNTILSFFLTTILLLTSKIIAGGHCA